MSQEVSQPVQDVFLAHLVKSQTAVTLFLSNGVKLQGTVAAYGRYALVLTRGGQSQLVFKHAISTVYPAASDELPRRQEAAVPAPGARLSLSRNPA